MDGRDAAGTRRSGGFDAPGSGSGSGFGAQTRPSPSPVSPGQKRAAAAAARAADASALRAVKTRLNKMMKNEELSADELTVLTNCTKSITRGALVLDGVAAVTLHTVLTRLGGRYPGIRRHATTATILGTLILHDYVIRSNRDACTRAFLADNLPNAAALRQVYREHAPDSRFLRVAESLALQRARGVGGPVQSATLRHDATPSLQTGGRPDTARSSSRVADKFSGGDDVDGGDSFDPDEYFGRDHDFGTTDFGMETTDHLPEESVSADVADGSYLADHGASMEAEDRGSNNSADTFGASSSSDLHRRRRHDGYGGPDDDTEYGSMHMSDDRAQDGAAFNGHSAGRSQDAGYDRAADRSSFRGERYTDGRDGPGDEDPDHFRASDSYERRRRHRLPSYERRLEERLRRRHDRARRLGTDRGGDYHDEHRRMDRDYSGTGGSLGMHDYDAGSARARRY